MLELHYPMIQFLITSIINVTHADNVTGFIILITVAEVKLKIKYAHYTCTTGVPGGSSSFSVTL